MMGQEMEIILQNRDQSFQDVQPASSYLVCVFLLWQDTNSLPIMNQRQLLAWLLVVASWRCMHKTALGQSLIAQLLPRLHDAGVT